MATDENRFKSEKDRLHWHRILGGILGSVPDDLLELYATKTLRAELESEDLLNTKQAFQRRTGYQADFNIDDFILNQVRNAGADVEAGPNREVFDASNALHALVEQTPVDCESTELTVLWREASALLALIDAHPGLQDQVDRAAWGISHRLSDGSLPALIIHLARMACRTLSSCSSFWSGLRPVGTQRRRRRYHEY